MFICYWQVYFDILKFVVVWVVHVQQYFDNVEYLLRVVEKLWHVLAVKMVK